MEARTGIPQEWFNVRPEDLHLDFLEWFAHQSQDDLFQTGAGRSLLPAIKDYETAKEKTAALYRKVIGEISDELSALKDERQKVYKQGGSMADIDRAIRNLLAGDVIEVLARRGFLPRYAFPLDVVTLETGRTRWSRDADVELTRDRGIAIAEFAPGAQIIARKKVFTCDGLYVVGNTDRPERWWYSRCPSCDQIRTSPTQDQLLGECSICQHKISNQYIKAFVEPSAFSVRVENRGEGTARHRRSTLIRQRQTLTHFIDSVPDTSFDDRGLFKLSLKEEGKLFRYNLGPENKGFMLCPLCGCSEPLRSFRAGTKHKRLRAFAGSMTCVNEQPWTRPLAYGHEFRSFCLIARPATRPASVESLAFALRNGMSSALDIDPSDIGVSWRWMSSRKGDSPVVEIILYDQAPGGAGFVRWGFENWNQVVQKASDICAKCTCEKACYDCLKHYSNQSYHEKLDRTAVADFLSAAIPLVAADLM